MDYRKVVATLLNQKHFGEVWFSIALDVPLTRMLQPFMNEGSDAYAMPPAAWSDKLADLVERKASECQVNTLLGLLASEAGQRPESSKAQSDEEGRTEHLGWSGTPVRLSGDGEGVIL